MKRENERDALPLTGAPDPPGATGRSCWFRRLAAALLVAIAASAFAAPALAQTEVPADWSLKPTGLAAGAQFRLLFLSSTKRNGSSTAIADYNTFVQGRAAAGHADIRTYSAGFRAVGCTSAVDARDNTRTTGTGVPIYWLNGAKAAADYADFYDQSWEDEVNDKNESGTDGPDTSNPFSYPLTGCRSDGTEAFSGSSSRALGASFVRVGRPDSAGNGPIGSNHNVAPTDSHPMYGLSAVFQVPPGRPPAFPVTRVELTVAENTPENTNIGEPIPEAMDPDGDTVTYTVVEGGDLYSFHAFGFDASTRQLKTSQPLDFERGSNYSLRVMATDTAGASDTIYVNITVTDVNESPVVGIGAPSQGANAGHAFSYTFPATTFSDEDGDTLTYTATKKDGTALPSWLTFTAATRTFLGTPASVDVEIFSVKVTASDSMFLVSDVFSIRVHPSVACSRPELAGRTEIWTNTITVGATTEYPPSVRLRKFRGGHPCQWDKGQWDKVQRCTGERPPRNVIVAGKLWNAATGAVGKASRLPGGEHRVGHLQRDLPAKRSNGFRGRLFPLLPLDK